MVAGVRGIIVLDKKHVFRETVRSSCFSDFLIGFILQDLFAMIGVVDLEIRNCL